MYWKYLKSSWREAAEHDDSRKVCILKRDYRDKPHLYINIKDYRRSLFHTNISIIAPSDSKTPLLFRMSIEALKTQASQLIVSAGKEDISVQYTALVDQFIALGGAFGHLIDWRRRGKLLPR
jgi:hypothetical protein